MNQPVFQTPAPLPRTCRDSSELLPAVNNAAVIKKEIPNEHSSRQPREPSDAVSFDRICHRENTK